MNNVIYIFDIKKTEKEQYSWYCSYCNASGIIMGDEKAVDITVKRLIRTINSMRKEKQLPKKAAQC